MTTMFSPFFSSASWAASAAMCFDSMMIPSG